MTNQRTFRVLVGLVALLALTACGGGSDAAETNSSSGGAASVDIVDNAFAPAQVSVSPGTTVSWTNSDDVPHTVVFDDDAVTDSEQMDEGDTFSATFDTAGEFGYLCSIHPDMTGTVTVR